jgi:hypothetical protein
VLPDFLVIGAPKAGTTSLHRTLGRHRDVFVPDNKEPCYFGLDDGVVPTFCGPGDDRHVIAVTVSHRADYEALFAEAQPGQLAGECSTQHLSMAGAAERAAALVPTAKIIAVLREPADRAYSHWSMKTGLGLEPLSFAAALDAEDERLAAGWAPCWGYRTEGCYAAQLVPWRARFGDDQLRVLLFDDFLADQASFVRQIFEFLGVDPDLATDTDAHFNKSGAVRSTTLQQLLRTRWLATTARRLLPRAARQRAVKAIQDANRPPPPREVIARLRESYRDEVDVLEGMLGRDLGAWRA